MSAGQVGYIILGAWFITCIPAARRLHRMQVRTEAHLFPALAALGRSGDGGLCVLGSLVWPVTLLAAWSMPGYPHYPGCIHDQSATQEGSVLRR